MFLVLTRGEVTRMVCDIWSRFLRMESNIMGLKEDMQEVVGTLPGEVAGQSDKITALTEEVSRIAGLVAELIAQSSGEGITLSNEEAAALVETLRGVKSAISGNTETLGGLVVAASEIKK